jgi:hypothetical protein
MGDPVGWVDPHRGEAHRNRLRRNPVSQVGCVKSSKTRHRHLIGTRSRGRPRAGRPTHRPADTPGTAGHHTIVPRPGPSGKPRAGSTAGPMMTTGPRACRSLRTRPPDAPTRHAGRHPQRHAPGGRRHVIADRLPSAPEARNEPKAPPEASPMGTREARGPGSSRRVPAPNEPNVNLGNLDLR